VDRGVGARKTLLSAETELKVARSSFAAAEKRLLVLGLSAADVAAVVASSDIDPMITLYAPVAGKVVGSAPVLGSMVDQSTEILTIMDPTTLCVDAEVYERDLSKLRVGQEVAVTVPAYPGEVFAGHICYIGDIVKPETRTITVRSEILNRGQRLKDGMFADVRLFLEGETKVLALPERAVLDDQDTKLVFVKMDGGYRPQTVQLGLRHAGYVEVGEGLEPGDEVVLDGNFQLKSKLFEEVLKGHGH
jgi:membrane fusion protein, heavy metal efflux system